MKKILIQYSGRMFDFSIEFEKVQLDNGIWNLIINEKFLNTYEIYSFESETELDNFLNTYKIQYEKLKKADRKLGELQDSGVSINK